MPFYRFQIETSLTQQVAMDRIRSMVKNQPDTSPKSSDPASRPFIGTVREDSFRLTREIHYRNSFLPHIWGRAVPSPAGTRITVTTFLNPAVALFMLVWLGLVFSFLLSTLTQPGPAAVMPCIMFVFGIGITCGGFFTEAFKAKKLLIAAFADATVPSGPLSQQY